MRRSRTVPKFAQVQALTRVAAARLASVVPQAGARHAWQPCQSRVKRYPPTNPLTHLRKWLRWPGMHRMHNLAQAAGGK